MEEVKRGSKTDIVQSVFVSFFSFPCPIFPVSFSESLWLEIKIKLVWMWWEKVLKSTFYVWHRCVFCTLPVVPGVVRHPPLPPGDLTGTVHQPGRGQCLEEYVPIIWRYSYFLLFYVANSNISQYLAFFLIISSNMYYCYYQMHIKFSLPKTTVCITACTCLCLHLFKIDVCASFQSSMFLVHW